MTENLINQEVNKILQDIKLLQPGSFMTRRIFSPCIVRDVETYNDNILFWSNLFTRIFNEYPGAWPVFISFVGVSESTFNPYTRRCSWEPWQQEESSFYFLGSQVSEINTFIDEQNRIIALEPVMHEVYFKQFKLHAQAGSEQDFLRAVNHEDFIVRKGLKKETCYKVRIPIGMLLKTAIRVR